MKIIITEIEANAEELRVSNSIADGFSNMIRRAFWPEPAGCAEDCEYDEGEGKE